jgi:hypothetical protein
MPFFTDDERELDAVWWQVHGDKVLQIAAAIISGRMEGERFLEPAAAKEIIDIAANLVHEVTYRQEPY